MRALHVILVAVFVAGCATAPVSDKAAFYDRKYNTDTYGAGSQGGSADANRREAKPMKAQPGWYRFGHP